LPPNGADQVLLAMVLEDAKSWAAATATIA
jgi:hypothetical protein